MQRNPVLLRQPALQRVEPLHQHRRRQPRAQLQVEGGGFEVGAPVRVNLREPFVGRAQLRRHPLVMAFQQRRRHERTHHDVELGGPHHGGAQRRGVAAQPLHGAQERVHLRQDGQVVRIEPVAGAVAELHRHRHHVLALRRQHRLIGRPARRRRHRRRPPQRRQQHQQRRRHRHRRQHHPPRRPAHRSPNIDRRLCGVINLGSIESALQSHPWRILDGHPKTRNSLFQRCRQGSAARHGNDLVAPAPEFDPLRPQLLIRPPMHSSAVHGHLSGRDR